MNFFTFALFANANTTTIARARIWKTATAALGTPQFRAQRLIAVAARARLRDAYLPIFIGRLSSQKPLFGLTLSKGGIRFIREWPFATVVLPFNFKELVMGSKKSVGQLVAVICSIAAIPLLQAASPISVDEALTSSTSAAEQFEALKTENALIKSRLELDKYIAEVGLSNTPLGKLSEANRAALLSSLTFNEKGLTSLNYRALESELTPTEIYRLTDLFGASRLTFMMQNARPATDLDRLLLNKGQAMRRDSMQKYVSAGKCQDESVDGASGCGGGTDYPGYWCISRATCSPQVNSICMSGC